MKKLGKSIGKAFVFCAVMMLLCSFAYPLALTGISQVAMKEKANGNLIDKNGNSTADPEEAVGSALVGQDFTEDYFFKGRVSSVNYNTYTEDQKENGEYAGVSSGSYNYGNSNPELKERIEKDLDEFLATHPGVKKEDVPSDLLTASGIRSGSAYQPGSGGSAGQSGGGTFRIVGRDRAGDRKGEYRRESAWHLRRSACQCFEMQPWNCRKDGIDLNGRRKTEFGSAFKKITI